MAGRDIDISVSSNRFENGTLERNPYISFNDFFSRSHIKGISRIETPSHPELIPSVLLTVEPVFREIM